MKIHPVGAELFRAGGRTDGHDVTNRRFSQFCGRAKIPDATAKERQTKELTNNGF